MEGSGISNQLDMDLNESLCATFSEEQVWCSRHTKRTSMYPYHVTLRGLEQIFYTTWHQTKFGVANIAYMDIQLISWLAFMSTT